MDSIVMSCSRLPTKHTGLKHALQKLDLNQDEVGRSNLRCFFKRISNNFSFFFVFSGTDVLHKDTFFPHF